MEKKEAEIQVPKGFIELVGLRTTMMIRVADIKKIEQIRLPMVEENKIICRVTTANGDSIIEVKRSYQEVIKLVSEAIEREAVN